MSRIGYLAKNTGYLALGQLGTKILSFFLVPLYTYVLTTEEYGTYDLLNTTASLLIPILSLNICDASLRFPLDKNYDRSDIFSISLHHLLQCTIWGGGIIALNHLFNVVPLINDYPLLFFLMLETSAANGIMNCFARGINKVKEVAVSGIICSVIIIFLNLLFLLPLHMGLFGYFLANILGFIGQSIYLFCGIKGWKYVKRGKLDKKLHREMLAFSKPMILNNISWWVNGVSNRYIIVWFCGVAANGIFSVSYKIPSILMMLQNIFTQAWTLSAVQEFDNRDKNTFFSQIYASYNVCMTIICSILIITSRPIASILYAKDFYNAWQYVPFLLIATVFGSLSGYIGGLFAAVKNTKAFATTSIIGAGTNLFITLLLVWKIDVIGAAIAAFFSYALIWYLRLRSIKQYLDLQVSYLRDCLGYAALVIQAIFLFIFEETVIFYAIETTMLFLLFFIHHHQVTIIYNKIANRIGLK